MIGLVTNTQEHNLFEKRFMLGCLIRLLGPFGLGAYILLCVVYRLLGIEYFFHHFILPCIMYIEAHCVVVGYVFHLL